MYTFECIVREMIKSEGGKKRVVKRLCSQVEKRSSSLCRYTSRTAFFLSTFSSSPETIARFKLKQIVLGVRARFIFVTPTIFFFHRFIPESTARQTITRSR